MSKFHLFIDESDVRDRELNHAELTKLRHLIREHECCGSCKFWGDWHEDDFDPPNWTIFKFPEGQSELAEEITDWCALASLSYSRFCMRYPPTVISSDSEDGCEEFRPLLNCSDWCGEYQRRVDHVSSEVE